MAHRPRAPLIETRSARLKLSARKKPYSFTTISPGIAVGYRRNAAAGTWVTRVADGRGGAWTKRVALADDYEEADGEHVLNFWQAIDRARKLARGSDADAGRPVTVANAVDAYERDLVARDGSVANAGRIRRHLTPTLASKPVGLVSARELAGWRDALLAGGMKSATLVRLCKVTKAALNLAAKRDPRILNRQAWCDALSGIAENFSSRNAKQRLDDDQVRDLITAATAVDPAFGLYMHAAAETGGRLSQISRLTVADLQADNGAPRLLMPASRKGRGRKPGKRPVPITTALAAKLRSNRPPEAPLLLRSDGKAWQSSQDGDHERLFRLAAARAGLPDGTTAYALRHSSIIRALISGVPVRIVASGHDSSVAMVERTYSAHISDYADTVARRGLLAPAAEPSAKVVALAGLKP